MIHGHGAVEWTEYARGNLDDAGKRARVTYRTTSLPVTSVGAKMLSPTEGVAVEP